MAHVGQESRLGRRLRAGAALSMALAAFAQGCKKDQTGAGEAPAPNDDPPVACQRGAIESVEPVARSSMFAAPLDATPSPDGALIYFTALTELGPAILRTSPDGRGEPTVLAAGDPLVAPFGVVVSTDGTRLYIADSGAEDAGGSSIGRIFVLSVLGGVPEELVGGRGTHPRSLDLVSHEGVDRIFFTGVDADAQAAIFRMDSDGSNRKLIRKGAPLADPSGIAVAGDGSIYVADAAGGESGGPTVLKIRDESIGEIASGLRFGHPAGIALFRDDSALLVSGLDPIDGTSVVFQIDLTSMALAKLSDGIGQNHDSAGLHRAHGGNVFAWSNASGDTRGETFTPGGTVYLLKGKSLIGCP